MRVIKIILLGTLLATTVGCKSNNYPRVQEQNYLAAHSIAPLRIPPGVSSADIRNEYPVSDRVYPRKDLTLSIEPPGLNSNA